MKERIRRVNFTGEKLARIKQIQTIVDEYQKQGIVMSARQLYYQFVSRALIPNADKEYKKLTATLTDARYAGMVDWDAIEDRGREAATPSEWSSPQSLMEAALRGYRLPRWNGQPYYVELWVEKQALAGVLDPLARQHHATLMVNKGYSSASAMKASAERIKSESIIDKERYDEIEEELQRADDDLENGMIDQEERDKIFRERGEELHSGSCLRRPVILYLGDHDPSGEDMVRDIKDRLAEFGVDHLTVEKIGLTMTQVKQYNPPPNPAKVTDPRAKDYVAKFGNKSWEVDALPPPVLGQIIRRAFAKFIDQTKLAEVKEQEEKDKELLKAAIDGVMKKRDK